MAQGSAVLAGSAPSPLGKAEDILGGEKARSTQLKTALDTYQSDEKIANDAETKKLGALDVEAGKLTPPKLDIPPPPQSPKTTDPVQVWGSLAMGVAALGSLMTRTPLTTAMNAVSEVIGAYRKGDQAAANQAFRTYEVASKNQIELASFQQKAYDQALAGIERREHMTIEERANADREATAKLNGVFRALGDQTAVDALEQRGLDAAMTLLEKRREFQGRMEVEGAKLGDFHAYHAELAKLRESPKYQAADHANRVSMLSDLASEYGPEVGSLHDPYQNPTHRQSLEKTLMNSISGKKYNGAVVANDQVQALAKNPDILHDPVSQIGMVDQYLFLETGSTRPALAQYQKLLGAATANDMVAMIAGKLPYHPILGPDQVRNIAHAAELTTAGTKQAYEAFLKRPENREIAQRLGMIDGSGNIPTDQAPAPSGKAPAPHPPKPGTVEDGYRFKGGDPSDQHNWEKVGG